MSTNFQFAETINPGAGSDASPRSSAPDPLRVFQVPIDPNDPRRGSAIVLALDDGTSAAATFWVRDDATKTWYQVGGSVSALPGALTDPVLLPSGADYFVRIGAVVGSPTLLRVGFVVGNSLAFSAGGAPAASTVTANQGSAGAAQWPVQSSQRLAASVSDVAAMSVTVKVALTSLAVTNRLIVQADYTNTTNVRLGPDATVSTTRGVQLAPGEAWPFFVANANELSAIAETGTCKLNLLAE